MFAAEQTRRPKGSIIYLQHKPVYCRQNFRLLSELSQPRKINSYQSVNPYNGEVLKTFEELSDKQLETLIETANICFESWRFD